MMGGIVTLGRTIIGIGVGVLVGMRMIMLVSTGGRRVMRSLGGAVVTTGGGGVKVKVGTTGVSVKVGGTAVGGIGVGGTGVGGSRVGGTTICVGAAVGGQGVKVGAGLAWTCHNRTTLSVLAEARKRPSGLKATAFTSA